MTAEQYRQYLDMINQWLILRHEGKSIISFLKKRNISTIAIYGMGIYARHLIRELKGTDIQILYGIDVNKVAEYDDIKVIQPTKELPEVDVIINTIIYDHINIEKNLKRVTQTAVLNLEEIVFESY